MRLPKRFCILVLQYILLQLKRFLSHPLSIIKTRILLSSCSIVLMCRLGNYLFMTRQYPICTRLKNKTIWIPSSRRILHRFHGVSKRKSTTPWKVSRNRKWRTLSSRINASFPNTTFIGTARELLRRIPIRQTKSPGSPIPSTATQPIKVPTLCLLQTRVIQTFAPESRLTRRI